MSDRWATFDCYGTLVDWLGGIRAPLAQPVARCRRRRAARQLPPARTRRPGRAGASLPRGDGRDPRRVAAAAAPRAFRRAGGCARRSLPAWPVFAEVPAALAELRDRGWRLAILSNTDPDLLDASLRAIGVPVDLRIVASEIGSYKPAFGHWEAFFARTAADRDRGTCTWRRRSSTTSSPTARARPPLRLDQSARLRRARCPAPPS